MKNQIIENNTNLDLSKSLKYLKKDLHPTLKTSLCQAYDIEENGETRVVIKPIRDITTDYTRNSKTYNSDLLSIIRDIAIFNYENIMFDKDIGHLLLEDKKNAFLEVIKGFKQRTSTVELSTAVLESHTANDVIPIPEDYKFNTELKLPLTKYESIEEIGLRDELSIQTYIHLPRDEYNTAISIDSTLVHQLLFKDSKEPSNVIVKRYSTAYKNSFNKLNYHYTSDGDFVETTVLNIVEYIHVKMNVDTFKVASVTVTSTITRDDKGEVINGGLKKDYVLKEYTIPFNEIEGTIPLFTIENDINFIYQHLKSASIKLHQRDMKCLHGDKHSKYNPYYVRLLKGVPVNKKDSCRNTTIPLLYGVSIDYIYEKLFHSIPTIIDSDNYITNDEIDKLLEETESLFFWVIKMD